MRFSLSIKHCFSFSITLLCVIQSIGAEELFLQTSLGEIITIEVDREETVGELLEKIENLEIENGLLTISSESPFIRKASVSRSYSYVPTKAEKEDIRFILTSLAKSTYTDLMMNKTALNKAGARIDHIHPLRFIECIFKDAETKASIHIIHSKKIIWKEFFDGLANTLKEEHKKNNIHLESILDLSISLGVNYQKLADKLQNKRWEAFVEMLLNDLPRSGDHNRYDI